MRLIGAVHRDGGHVAASGEPFRAHVRDRRLARRHERMHRRDRRRVVDDAFECPGQPDQLAQPAERHLFELGRGGRRAPQHRLLIERGGQEIGEHAGSAAGDREVRHEARMIPVREAGHEHAFEVAHDLLERLGIFRRLRRERIDDVARPHAREDRVLVGVFQVVRDPVDERVAVFTEIVGVQSTSAFPPRPKGATMRKRPARRVPGAKRPQSAPLAVATESRARCVTSSIDQRLCVSA